MEEAILKRLDRIGELLVKIEENTRKKPKTKNKGPTVGSEIPELQRLWNTWKDPELPEAVSVGSSSPRYRNAQARWREIPKEGYWIKVIRAINESDFCTGKIIGKDKRAFFADFEFLCRPSTHAKVLEEKYKNEKTAPGKEKKQYRLESGETVWG